MAIPPPLEAGYSSFAGQSSSGSVRLPSWWRSSAIVLVVLASSALLASRAAARVFLFICLVPAAVVLVRVPGLGLLAILLTGMSVPYTIGTGTGTTLHTTVFIIPVLLVLWLLEMLREKKIQVRPSPLYLPLLVFILSATVSFVGGSLPWSYLADRASLAAQAGGWSVFILSAATFLLAANRLPDLRWLKILTALLLVYGGLATLARVSPGFAEMAQAVLHDKALGGMLWVWVTALAGSQALFNRRLQRGLALAVGLFSVAPFVAGFVFSRDWASGWLPALMTFLTLLLLRRGRMVLIPILIVALGLLLVFPDLPAALVAGDRYSIDTRFDAWQILMNQVIQLSPWIGLGPANYYHYTPMYGIRGYSVEFSSHNNFVDVLMQTGLVGFLGLMWFLLAVAAWAWSLRERVEPGFSRGYVYGCLAALAGTVVACMLGDWFIPFVYNVGIAGLRASLIAWLFLGGLVLVGQTAVTRGRPA